MDITSWFCTNNARSSFVRIVHPGGHVELHDRPVLAVEVMLRNPRCLVGYPHVFKQPTALVAPETTLMPGQKFYVVPVRTIRKLQRKMKQYTPSLSQDVLTSHQQHSKEHVNTNGDTNWCCSFWNMNSPKHPYTNLEQSNPKNDCCFSGLMKGINRRATSDDSRNNAASSANNSHGGGSNMETRLCSAKKLIEWQPNLQRIIEE
ncbi:hypothetical protein LIER_34027 [Lithospermum erythrorhizon]|uniref:Uncharacterized protein n=1 Tax=Lithospermum erythrorhizon TaxID=34254 RepID=A0AAV3S1Z7_LITER